MPKFVIEPHFRLQEWVAEEKGYFRAEGLDYEFREFIRASGGAHHATRARSAPSSRSRRAAQVERHLRLPLDRERGGLAGATPSSSPTPIRWRPSAIFVPANSPVRSPADLAGVPISVGYQSGSHYATIQALEQYMPADKIKLSFGEGMLFDRMEAFLDGKAPACTLFSGPYYFAEQLGFRKIIDNTFMIAAMLNGDPEPEDVRKYFRALRRAQRDIDLRPELYTHYYKAEFPERFHARMDTRAWGPGERIVFEPYTKEVYEQSFAWIAKRELFEAGTMGAGKYEDAVITLASHGVRP